MQYGTSPKREIEKIDTLMYVRKLEASGVPREQAELQVQIMADIVDKNYATKQDLKDLRIELKHDMLRLEDRLTIKLGSIMMIGLGALASIIKFFLEPKL